MAKPQDRTAFKEYCLRSLGKPVIEINVDDTQVDDRVDEALRYYWDYHFDGSEKIYYKHIISAEDKENKYIILPENIIGAVKLFQLGFLASGQDGLFNVQYQMAMNDMFAISSWDIVPYYMMRQNLNVLQEILIGEKPIRYNRHMNKLNIDMNWDLVEVNQYLVVEAYQVVDPDIYQDAWSDRWLLRYATALIKRQWGNNLKKFGNMQMPGGATFNGQQVFDEAEEEIKAMEHEMINSYSLPVTDMIG
jgi:hypothetical protein